MLVDSELKPEVVLDVVIRFAGDSGDGMQLTGDRFTDASAVFGNDLATNTVSKYAISKKPAISAIRLTMGR